MLVHLARDYDAAVRVATRMTEPRIEILPIEQGATPDPNNSNKHTQRGRGFHENSMRKRGANRSIASAGKGVEIPVVTAGNQTLEIAAEIGMKGIINVHTNGDYIVNVVRDDIEPGSAEAIALGIEDNEIGKQSYNPDIDVIAALSVGENAVLAALKEQDGIFGGLLDGMITSYPEKLPPDDFQSYDENIETEHTCPKCGYKFSGGK